MNPDRFWLTDVQFARIEPHLPIDTRGKPRIDDRRVISGIVHVLKSGGRWIDAPPDYGPSKTLYNRYVRWAAKGIWVDLFHVLASAGGPPAQVLIDSSAVKAHRSASGGKGGKRNQAIGRSRGGRTTKIHALTDCDCRPIAFLLTGGQVADCTAGSPLLEQMPAARILHGDKDYDSNAIRRQIEENGTMPNIPPKANRRWKNCFSPVLYRDRNAIERMFCRIKDFRRVATRYDRKAVNFLEAVCIAATVNYWL
ncbi:IS5 family transposase [Bosea sp. FBZP-16]|uniref:IS5 family transposase n=1 Tax=Bosea sp. FBZP-16 TaxID=2065382 RepID=UPI000C304045|nr:IS5 family transposase [Bosea sp. FBZP-16]